MSKSQDKPKRDKKKPKKVPKKATKERGTLCYVDDGEGKPFDRKNIKRVVLAG